MPELRIADYVLRIIPFYFFTRMSFKSFEEMPIWQQSIRLAKRIYALSGTGPFAKDYGLKDQIRRAIVSVSSNIVEGYERSNNREFIRFLLIAKASANEVRSQLYLAKEIGYLDSRSSALIGEMKQLSNSIGGFVAYLRKYERNNS